MVILFSFTQTQTTNKT